MRVLQAGNQVYLRFKPANEFRLICVEGINFFNGNYPFYSWLVGTVNDAEATYPDLFSDFIPLDLLCRLNCSVTD